MDNEWLRNDIKAGRFGLGAFVALRSLLGTISYKLDK
jgi:hypothetical protein